MPSRDVLPLLAAKLTQPPPVANATATSTVPKDAYAALALLLSASSGLNHNNTAPFGMETTSLQRGPHPNAIKTTSTTTAAAMNEYNAHASGHNVGMETMALGSRPDCNEEEDDEDDTDAEASAEQAAPPPESKGDWSMLDILAATASAARLQVGSE